MKVVLLHPLDHLRVQLAAQLRNGGLDVQALADADELPGALASHLAGVVVLDLMATDADDALELLAQCRLLDPNLPVVALGDGDALVSAAQAAHPGACSVLARAQWPRLAMVCRQAMHAHQLALRGTVVAAPRLAEDAPPRMPIDEVLRGRHPAIVRLRQTLLRLARIDTDVLVKAETGCGKEVVARCLHDFGPRAGKRFVAINCGAIPENIFESELFGHEAGAFTGASKRRIGKLEHAAGGTVFLDEIESMPLAMQVKLLRALQQRSIERVGGNESVRLTCRVVAAAKDDLLELSRAGRFRMDLYYRINVVELSLPPLRERREDIALLAEAFAREAAQHHGLPAAPLGAEFVCGLMARDWTGNVRELRNVVERHVLGVPEMTGLDEPESRSLPQLVATFERAVIAQCLRMCGGSVTRASEVLQVPRKTLYDKLTRFAVDPSEFRADVPPGFAAAAAPACALLQ
ncbi:MAG TPA: sigma-54 dependent transcriptional regulator [Albitalea sp.]|nr:sigma-54 dependent transcriptional regulator [Albitalea sp.]